MIVVAITTNVWFYDPNSLKGIETFSPFADFAQYTIVL